MDVELTPSDVVQPDIIVIDEERRGIISPSHVIGIPDLLVEILSPSNPSHDTELKHRLYERTGVPEYWIVDSRSHTLTRHLLQGDRYGEPQVFTEAIELRRGGMHAHVDLTAVWKALV
ncbi:MAG: hypothetical protein GVY29_07570 [Spirochaetes bacterium]|jgi:Uma2 family endonuclease|nr:hypothetical protein [Spirochaetota bacterium]